ncbi:capsular polysaccharide biosynthesis protein [Tabrizicola sp. J26]|uniref:capsular polysaccharide biosynthesis protein n=1 Tax=Alitabrizicola rongguiensis TaxID=2909234 RepID=UPI001F3DD2E6|nr:capsular polysaccharide biosynthesis protein [Tabrizicola rongguiensis]MCF1708389.1 capsular polysaccharide biosynthesis protein [Tabrizicola rongguiensis]
MTLTDTSGEQRQSRLYAFNAGLLKPGRARRILTLAGLPPHLGRPGPDDLIAVWGRSPYAARGEAMAARSGAALLRIEDAFLRSLRPGRSGDATMGLILDRRGVHFDASAPSDLEHILSTDRFEDHSLIARARDGIARLQALDISKYSGYAPNAALPQPGYVLVVDQLQGDASVRHGGLTPQSFREMLVRAQEEHPGRRVVVKLHPETVLGLRPGHYGPADASERVTLLTENVSPWRLLEGAIAVYVGSSQLGFEAILAGHRPHVFGQPFYAGWGLSEDEAAFPRRRRKLTKVQLFAGAMLLAPTWYDPCRDRLASFEEVVDQLEAELRPFREDVQGHVAMGMRLWKRRTLQHFFGRRRPLRFANDPAKAAALAVREGRGVIAWGMTAPEGFPLPVRRIEDGFLRSRGLGASLVPPLSLVADDLGLYYDPSRESRLDRLISSPAIAGGEARAARLVERIVGSGLSKYNLGQALSDLPEGHRILVPGQVEDDASIRFGAPGIRTNLDLLRHVRAENPGAVILYKPHPDVEAGLRPGRVVDAEIDGLADAVLPNSDPAALLPLVQEVWTMTSLLGFEALLRGVPVTCLGLPFYAGWGLTRDVFPAPRWRRGRPTLMALAHAALIAYPRYLDPVTGRPCPPEVIVDRLIEGYTGSGGLGLGLLSRLQGLLAGQSHLWR